MLLQLKERKAVGTEGGSRAKTIFFFKDKKLNSTFYANPVDRENLVMQGRQGISQACP